ncbi:MAG: hypothetical protein K8S87_03410, partial [Planctomycetes bacterium]|nr:hypothetical protein [Planctomycetota bacterium]
IILIKANKALYISEINRLEIAESVVMYMLSKVYGRKFKIDERNLINYDMRLQSSKLLVRWEEEISEKAKTDKEPQSTKFQTLITTDEEIMMDYPLQGIDFRGKGLTFREGSPTIRIHKNVEVNYNQSLNPENLDEYNEMSGSFKLTGMHGAVLNFIDIKEYKLKSIDMKSAVKFIQKPQSNQLNCNSLSIRFNSGEGQSLRFEKITAEGDVRYLTPNRFSLNCDKLEFFYENLNNKEKFLGVFTGIERAIMFTDDASEIFGTSSEDDDNLFTYYLCHAEDKIIFERELEQETDIGICGFEKWRFVSEAKIERKIVKLDISGIGEGSLLDRTSFLEGRKITGKVESSQVDLVLQGKEEISFYFELIRATDLLDKKVTDVEHLERNLTRLEVKNSLNRSTLEFNIEKLGNVYVFAEALIYVQKSALESHILISGQKPKLILKTMQDFRFTRVSVTEGNYFRYILSAQNSIFISINYEEKKSLLDKLTISSAEGIELRKTPLRLTQAAIPEHYSLLKAYDIKITFSANENGDLELSNFIARSSEDIQILYEISNNRIETEYLEYNSHQLSTDLMDIDEELLPNWKLIYAPYATSIVLKGNTKLRSADSELNKLIMLNDSQGSSIIPTLIDLSADKNLSYSMVYLKSREKFISLNNKLSLGEDITVLAFDNEDKLLSVTGRNLILESARDLKLNIIKIRHFEVLGKSAKEPALLEYVHRDLTIKAGKISIIGEQKNRIELIDSPTITFTITNLQIVDEPDTREEKPKSNQDEFEITVKFPETEDENLRSKQKITAVGFIEMLEITSRCEIILTNKNNTLNKMNMKADRVQALFSSDDEKKSGIELEISKIIATGNVLIADGKREVNGDKLTWETEKGVSIKLEGENSILKESRNGKTIYVIKGINNYVFRDKSKDVISRKNVIKLKSKKGIKITVNR